VGQIRLAAENGYGGRRPPAGGMLAFKLPIEMISRRST